MGFKLTKTQLRKKMEMEALMPPKIGSSFTCFGSLPAELRVKVWKEAATGTPRIIKLRLNQDYGLGNSVGERRAWSSIAKVPGLLHTCKEARYEGLKIYKKFFTLLHKGKTIGEIYFNPRIDTLYLDQNCFQSGRGHWHPDNQALTEIEHLAIQTDFFVYHNNQLYRNPINTHLGFDELAKFTNLKTLTLARDFTTIAEHKREEAMAPLKLRQRFTDEQKTLVKCATKFDKMVEKDTEKMDIWMNGTMQGPKPQHVKTVAVRVLGYEEGAVVYDNGMKGYDESGKWEGYGRGRFVRLSKGWRWVVPPQWHSDEERHLWEDRKLAMDFQMNTWR